MARVAALAAMTWVAGPVGAGEMGFPFDRELLLDAPPLPGSKRVPSLEIGPNGTVDLDMWCNRARAQAVVVANTITVIVGPATQRPCTPERMQADRELLAALSQVETWRWEDDVLVLEGPRILRFRLQTN